jgi:hypothetical protein
MTSPGDLKMSYSDFSFTPALNLGKVARIAKKYLDNGMLRGAVDSLGLDNDKYLEMLVLELQSGWGSVVEEITRLKKNPNEATGELSDNAVTLEDFMFGSDVVEPDDIDGRLMFQAVKNMSVLVVRYGNELTYEGQRDHHEWVVVTMFIEAIHALQHDRECAFRAALLDETIEKVKGYESSQQGYGETMDKFRLRTALNKLAHEEAMHKNLLDENDWLKQKNKNLEKKIRKMKIDNHPLALHRGNEEDDAQFKIRTLQSKLAAYEIRELEGYQENQQLKVELGLEKGRHERAEVKREFLRQRVERRELEILQLKQNMAVLHELSELKLEDDKNALQEEWFERRVSLEVTNENYWVETEEKSNKIFDQAHKIKTQAEKIKRLTKKINARETKSARLMMRQAVKLLNKLAK